MPTPSIRPLPIAPTRSSASWTPRAYRPGRSTYLAKEVKVKGVYAGSGFETSTLFLHPHLGPFRLCARGRHRLIDPWGC